MSKVSEPAGIAGTQASGLPYSQSWIDSIVSTVERLPGPPWVSFLGLGLSEALLNNGLRWADGTLPVGTFDPFRVAEAFFVPYMLAGIYYLSRVAKTSLDSFSPVLAVPQSELETLRYQLTTTPAKHGLITGVLGALLGILNMRADPAGYGISSANAAYTYVYALVFAGFTSAVGIAFFWHTVRLLWQVNRIHDIAEQIDLYDTHPLYSFSRLTVRTGITLLILVYSLNFFLGAIRLQDQAVRPNLLGLGIVIVGSAVAIASFFLPLYGMHVRLAGEKEKMIRDSNRRFRASTTRLHTAIDRDDIEVIEGMQKAISSLSLERDTLARISTWPWETGTLRGFATAVALPIIVFLITRALDRFLGP